MQVIFETRDPEAGQFRPLAVRRIRQALRRLKWLAPRARVHLSAVNGPSGGIDKRCQIELLSNSVGPVVITSMARDWGSALNSALARAAQSLLHNWQPAREVRRVIRPPLVLES